MTRIASDAMWQERKFHDQYQFLYMSHCLFFRCCLEVNTPSPTVRVGMSSFHDVCTRIVEEKAKDLCMYRFESAFLWCTYDPYSDTVDG